MCFYCCTTHFVEHILKSLLRVGWKNVYYYLSQHIFPSESSPFQKCYHSFPKCRRSGAFKTTTYQRILQLSASASLPTRRTSRLWYNKSPLRSLSKMSMSYICDTKFVTFPHEVIAVIQTPHRLCKESNRVNVSNFHKVWTTSSFVRTNREAYKKNK